MPYKKILFLLLLSVSIPSMAQSSSSPQVEIITIEAPQIDTLRNIRIYLPAEYGTSKVRYPVLYMHDAQNLFDTITAFSGEWRIDEFLDSQKGEKIIVVGIDHGNEKRIAELTPFANEKYGGGEGAEYVDFLVNTLKPHIDSTYQTLTEAENTAIAGSSLGGLISFYAVLQHPEVFGKAGIFSPSFWFSDKIFEFAKASKLPKTTRFYFVGGTAESESMIPQLLEIKQILLKLGLPENNLQLKTVQDGEHNEDFWSREFPESFQWLFPFEEAK